MYGEGYDWTPLYSIRSGQFVGAIPVGIETKGIADVPYWPSQICWTYKEVWVQPAGQWIDLMADLSGPAVVRGTVEPGSTVAVRLIHERTHAVITASVAADGTFRAVVPQGHYSVDHGVAHTALIALPGGLYHIDLRRDHAVTFTAASSDAGSGDIIVRATIEGAGNHTLSIRTDNLAVSGTESVPVNLGSRGRQQISWHAQVLDPSSPWVAVLLRDASLSGHVELSGIPSPVPGLADQQGSSR